MNYHYFSWGLFAASAGVQVVCALVVYKLEYEPIDWAQRLPLWLLVAAFYLRWAGL